MAATIAHEINNPLDAVMNLTYLARTSLANDSKAVAYLISAEDELDRVAHIARQSLGFYRDPGSPIEVHIEQIIERVLEVYRTRLLTANVAVDCRFNHHRTIVASSGELVQVFSNLVTNAVDAMAVGGRLSFQTYEGGEEGLQIVVRDNGTGIANKVPEVTGC